MTSTSETGVKGVKDIQPTEKGNIISGTTDRPDVMSKTQPTGLRASSQASKVQSSPAELEPNKTKGTRKRTMTGKGQAYTLERCKRNREGLAVSLTVKLRKINVLMAGDPDLSVMRRKYTEWMEIFENFLLSQEEYENLLPSIEADDEGETHKAVFAEFKRRVEDWFLEEESQDTYGTKADMNISQVGSSIDDIRADDSVSQVNRGRKTGASKSVVKVKATASSQISLASASSSLVKARLKTAELEAKNEMLQKRQALIKKRLEIEQEEEQLEIEEELAIATADMKILEAESTFSRKLPSITSLKSEPKTIKTLEPLPLPSSHNSSSEEMMLKIVREMKKPTTEMKKFGGNILEYKQFRRKFKTKIIANTDDTDEMMDSLEYFTTGKPNDIVSGYAHLDAKEGFPAAMEELDRMYGDNAVIAQAYVKKASSWPVIKSDDSKGLEDFAIFLVECKYGIKGMQTLDVLENSGTLQKLLSKLPTHIQDKWRTKYRDCTEKKVPAKFDHLVEIVQRESIKANDPLFGKEALKSDQPAEIKRPSKNKPPSFHRNKPSFATDMERKPNQNETPKGRHFAIESKEAPSNFSKSTLKDGHQKPCLFCNDRYHSMTTCQRFGSMDFWDKKQFLRSNEICYGCLRSGHMKFQCPDKLVCQHCKKSHPTILHRSTSTKKEDGPHHHQTRPKEIEQFESPASLPAPQKSKLNASAKTFTSSSVNTIDEIHSHAGAGVDECTLAIVPVLVRQKKTKRSVITYAFKDPGSTLCFCTNSLIDRLGMEGRKRTITIETMGSPYTMETMEIDGLEILDLDGVHAVELPTVYAKEHMPISKHHIPTQEDLKNWPHLRNINIPKIDADIGLLIGNGVPDAYTPLEVITGPAGTPHAARTRLGWTVWNLIRCSDENRLTNTCNFVSDIRKDEERVAVFGDTKNLETMFRNYVNLDFPEKTISDRKEKSIEDRKFEHVVRESIIFQDNHYYINLPFRNHKDKLPNNNKQALVRLGGLKRKFERNPQFHDQYIKFMNDMIEEGYSEMVPDKDLGRDDGRVWYIPHHGVFKKQDKIRIVYDCSAKYRGVALNDLLLPGPNLTNSLLGVLLRFREGNVALMADIKSMFHQVKVPVDDRDCLRFYWWKDGNCHLKPDTFRMTVHLFGAASSPSCAASALLKTAEDNENLFSEDIIEIIRRNFYVDDCLKSIDSPDKAVTLVNDLTKLCEKGGFKLTKWVSNDRNVLETISVDERAKDLVELDLDYDQLPIEHALGVSWSVESDTLGFKIKIQDRPPTRRGILSIVSSVYDPLGLAAPFVLPAKIILQDLCHRGIGWDELVKDADYRRWNKWLAQLPLLESLTTPRCYKPNSFGTIVSCQLHYFSDASEQGYGMVTYIRLVNEDGRIHCNIVMGKSRVSPLKMKTIPRMELTAAMVSVRTHHMILKELDMSVDDAFFWTDSMSVLRYLANEKTRFHTFVANRITVIHEGSELRQWKYVETSQNPADDASRGLLVGDEVRSRRWLTGPDFLWKEESYWPHVNIDKDLPEDDGEVKKKVIAVVSTVENPHVLNKLSTTFSSWTKLRTILGWVLLFIDKLKISIKQKMPTGKRHSLQRIFKGRLLPLPHEYFVKAERTLILHVQKCYFKEEIESLEKRHNGEETALNKGRMRKSSKIYKLDPLIKDDILRVGGRLDRASIPEESKHQIILPKDSAISLLILDETHRKLGHLGRESILSRVRQKYWIVGANAQIKKMLADCVICRKYQRKPGEQKMADLPFERLIADQPPFTNTGVDFFGPFEIKRARSTVKRYGIVFTCLAIRAVHLEVAHSLNTDSCINALRRFIARRGNVRTIISDNGTNFVGAKTELSDAIKEWNQSKISELLNQSNITWKMNPPSGSHFGGIWERQIRTVRKIMFSLLKEQVIKLDDEHLVTLFCEVENIINSRPITKNSNDPNDLEAITPNNLLLLQNNQNLPPGVFIKEDTYTRRRWRQVQYLANIFWKRWMNEYLPTLQQRAKWIRPRRNVKEDDVVLIVDNNTHRNSWSLARVIEVIKDKKGFVRIAKVKTKSATFTRPIDKLCVILEAEY